MSDCVSKLIDAINQSSDNSMTISMYEQLVSKHIESVLNDKSLYTIPLNNLINIIKLIEFDVLEDPKEFTKTYIKNATLSHSTELDVLDLLKYIQTNNIEYTLNECIDIFNSFDNIPLCHTLVSTYRENESLPDVDYEYELSKRANEIEELRSELEKCQANARKHENKLQNAQQNLYLMLV